MVSLACGSPYVEMPFPIGIEHEVQGGGGKALRVSGSPCSVPWSFLDMFTSCSNNGANGGPHSPGSLTKHAKSTFRAPL